MVQLTREQLYKWVWSIPVLQIAKELGITGTAIKKKCRLFEIPTPGRGHWMKVEQGQQVKPIPLLHPDKFDMNVPVTVTAERAAQLELLPVLTTDMSHVDARSDLSPGQAALDDCLSHVVSDPEKQEDLTDNREFLNGRSALHKPCRDEVAKGGTPQEILYAANEQENIEKAKRFLVNLKSASQACDPPTKAVLALWIEEAKHVLARSDPISLILTECRQVAVGELNPVWWSVIQSDSGRNRTPTPTRDT